MIGGLAPTFYNMEVSSDTLMRQLGVSVEHVDIHAMTNLMVAQSNADVSAELAKMIGAADVRGVSDAQMDLTVRAVLALRSIARSGGYDGVGCVRLACFAGKSRYASGRCVQLA